MKYINKINFRFLVWMIAVFVGMGAFVSIARAKDDSDLVVHLKSKKVATKPVAQKAKNRLAIHRHKYDRDVASMNLKKMKH